MAPRIVKKKLSEAKAKLRAEQKRRANAEKISADTKVKIPRKKKPALPKKDKRRTKLEKELADTRAALAKMTKEREAFERELRHQEEISRLTADFVPMYDMDRIRADGTIAVESCRLRHLSETDELRAALQRADDRGEDSLRDMAETIAELYNVPIREVYTLHFSP